jgi:DNA-binding response OmpR family regulator
VEDAVLLALELETGLAEAGAEVIGPAYELEEALALLDRPIDVAVLDANLNGRSVTPVAEALLARRVPFLFATGYGEGGGAPGGFDAPVIRKPYDVSQVAAAVADLLRGSGKIAP